MSDESKPSDPRREERIKEEASEWIAKHDRGITAQEQDAFFDWLAEDPDHAAVYREREAVWRSMDLLAQWRPEHSLEPNPDLLAVPEKRASVVWYRFVSGLAAVLAMTLLVWNFVSDGDDGAVTLLASGESARFYEHHVLEDGSIVELNRGAQVSVRFLDDKRLIDLLSGEAHFTVAKDVNRPFVVRARGAVVQAVGTAFNVSLNPDQVEVIVTEGRVLMNPSIATTNESIVEEKEPLVRKLHAGQFSVVALNKEPVAPVVQDVEEEEISQRLAWKNEMLDFTDTPLSEVILEFNRRNHTQIVIADVALNAIPVTAAFRPNRLDEFVELLVLTDHVRAERVGLSKIILHSGE
ncbi:FecR family protein [Pelagicoccus albus]|uniref:FecR domain-containing protein n=1 Tax=Pelagicoccus albus TaxID=415222 RepID=A0A7X1B7L8_9BACT|nr:FecR domain-containing protein [Pelagicoccus albus]MBC2607148.1 FecR domain-containing protein [Pelagicoccus albus]